MMLSGSRISQQLREYNSQQLGFYSYINNNRNNNCYYYHYEAKAFQLSSSFIQSLPFSFTCNIPSSKKLFRLKLLTPNHSYSSSPVTNDNDDLAGVSSVNNDNCVQNTTQAPLLSDCFSQAGDSPNFPSERLSPVAGGIVALGKFDALHIGHRELAIRAAKIGVPFLLSFVGMAEILGWEPRAPIVAKCDRKRVLSSWAPLCNNVTPKEFQVEFSKVRYLTPRQFVEKLSKELGVRGVVAGQNYRFGYRAAGDALDLVQLCKECGLSAYIINSVMDKNQDPEDSSPSNSKEQGQVSSTRVRYALANGDMKYVSELLGRHHRLIVTVKNKENVFSDRKRLSAPRSCLLNLPPREGLYKNCSLLIGDEIVVPCRVIIDITAIHLDFDDLAPHVHFTAQNLELLSIEFGDLVI